MPNNSPSANNLVLARFAEAWGRKDAAAVAALMAPDCVYEASVGPEPGATYSGQAELISGLERMFALDDGARTEISDQFLCGDRAAWEWRYYGADGALIARGCDLFELGGGLIRRKNAFRKVAA